MQDKNIVFTGGHHNSALVVAEKFLKKGYQVFWFGHKHSMRDDKSITLEYKEVKKAGLNFIVLKTSKFYRHYNPFNFLKIFYGVIQAFIKLLKIRPKAIIAFGGYLSVPVVLAGWILRIDCFLHEQTSKVGLANKFLSVFAKKVFLTWEESSKFFKKSKTVVTGLPLPDCFFTIEVKNKIFKNQLPTIFITGGKQGSSMINCIVEKKLENYLKQFNLIHQTGGNVQRRDFERLKLKKKKLSLELQKRYKIQKFFYRKEMIKNLKRADFIISRSGAHIVWELFALEKKALLIPYPWAYQQEQLSNARILEQVGLAKIVLQKKLQADSFYKQVKSFYQNLDNYKLKQKKQKDFFKGASSEIVKEILK